jgi:hypothetical protein
LLRELVPHFEHRLFLTATPHNGYLESFTALLELLDDQRFARGVRPRPDPLAEVMVRRMKRDLPPRFDGTPRFPERVLEPITVTYTDAERAAHDELASGRTAVRRAAAARSPHRPRDQPHRRVDSARHSAADDTSSPGDS